LRDLIQQVWCPTINLEELKSLLLEKKDKLLNIEGEYRNKEKTEKKWRGKCGIEKATFIVPLVR